MRIDAFMNATNIVKRRSIAQDMIDNRVVKIDGVCVKASRNVKVGDVIEIAFFEKSQFFKVLKIPEIKNVPKSLSYEYVEKIVS
ncbi:hypothetical protein CCZ01_03055 [Helicobacter monodelphidis]|uniref:RNA-binding S4 domain-containing protein n=1 Tax=Helicobacter sp. 15-1451 TaxID=2004995 RepID=UPI000DCB7DB4|nr:RNA-binding S4 domain-containing protein [Helicobacter sp. 15-1451]RAX58410.1 hypothetical protein CCZ01_03055 [Helicobacter sp. 15-1451]